MNEAKPVKKQKVIDLTQGEPFKLILIYSLPILLGNIFQQLYSMCDTLIVSRMLGPKELAAVGNTGPMSFLVLGFLYGMTSGFSVITAQRFGAQDQEGLKKSVAVNIILNGISAIVVTAIACSIATPILNMTHTPDDIFQKSQRYILIVFGGTCGLVLYNACSCILRAVGDSRTPLYFLIFSSFLNIGLDVLFIKKTGDVSGAAWATIISQGISGILCLVWILIKYPNLHVKKEHFRLSWKFIWQHLGLGMNMGFQFSITAVGIVVLQGALNSFGSIKIAAYTAAQKVEQLITTAAAVLGVAMTNYAGQNMGAGRLDRVKEGVRKAGIMSLIIGAVAGVVCWFLSDQMTSIFIDKNTVNPEDIDSILKTAKTYLHTCGIFFPILCALFVYRNSMQGIGKGFWPLMGGILELISRTIVAYTLPAVIGFTGVCAAGPIAWLAATIPLFIAYQFTIHKMLRQNESEQSIV